MLDPRSAELGPSALGRGSLRRFVQVCVGHQIGSPERFLTRLLDDAMPLLEAAGSVETRQWTRAARACREYLEPLEPSEWWASARAAEHRWADPEFTVDSDAISQQLQRPDRVAALFAVVPAVDRIAVALCDVESLPDSVAARITRCPDQQTTQRLRRGRMAMVCLLDPSPTARATTRSEWPDELDCSRARASALAAPADELRRGMPGLEHVTRCERCSQLVTALTRLVDRLRQLPVPAS